MFLMNLTKRQIYPVIFFPAVIDSSVNILERRLCSILGGVKNYYQEDLQKAIQAHLETRMFVIEEVLNSS